MTRILDRIMMVRMMVLTSVLFIGFSILNLERLHAAPRGEALQSASVGQVINVNRAETEELQLVRGIGPMLAERIIVYRQENGPFESLDDLANVRGIGGAKLQRIKGQITI